MDSWCEKSRHDETNTNAEILRRTAISIEAPSPLETHRDILVPNFLGRLLDIGDQVEIETAVRAQRDRNEISDVIQIGEKEIAELIDR